MRAKLICCALCALCCNPARAGLVNADFETGDLSGWTVTYPPGSVSTINAEPDGAGGFRAVLRMTTTVPNQEARADMRQSFTIVEGSDLSFDYEWNIADSTFGGGLVVRVSGPTGIEPGEMIGTGAGTRTMRLTPGEYIFQLYSTHIANLPDTFDGWLAIDNITLTPVPEPGSLVLLFVGLALVTHWGTRRSNRASKS